jgi:hypothetical protein
MAIALFLSFFLIIVNLYDPELICAVFVTVLAEIE